MCFLTTKYSMNFKCLNITDCPLGLYINGLCENKIHTVQCCYSLNYTFRCENSTKKLSHDESLRRLKSVNISISSSGGCTDRNDSKCTSLEGVNCKTIAQIVEYKIKSGCQTIITGKAANHFVIKPDKLRKVRLFMHKCSLLEEVV